MLLTESILQATRERFNRPDVKRAQQTPDGERKLKPAERTRLLTRLMESGQSQPAAAAALERVLEGNDLMSINYLERGTLAARSVCRIILRDARQRTEGYGTGFLVAPGLLMTNHHVLHNDLEGGRAQAEFDYEQDARGENKRSVTVALNPAACFFTHEELDFTLIAVSGGAQLSPYGWLPLRPEPGKSFEGEYLTIIQHPGGQRKQVCVRENKLIKYEQNTVWYQTDTTAGSSGSPVFNSFWEVVALHHSGVPKTDASGNWLTIDGKKWDNSMDESLVKWEANEGIRISRICEYSKLHHASHAAVASMLRALEPPPVASPTHEAVKTAAGAGGAPVYWSENQLFVSLPVRALAALETPILNTAQQQGPPSEVVTPGEGLLEKVEIDTSTYSSRPGYQPKFLGVGLTVPLPTLTAATQKLAAPLKKASGPGLLKYFNYSVMMHAKRRLALFACVNIDGSSIRDTGAREDSWITDLRMDDKFQLGQSFYSGKLQESTRVNPWDRGHLVRRLDATWGSTVEEAKRQGDDTFHFTNCSPQHFAFNQGAGATKAAALDIPVSRLWAGLEDYALEVAIGSKRACVFNGPVFTAADKKYLNVQIPQEFWKILIIRKDGKLSAAGFVLSQKVLVDKVAKDEEFVPRPLSELELKLAQRPIAEIAKRTGLNFGPLVKADAFKPKKKGATEAAGRDTIESFSDIDL